MALTAVKNETKFSVGDLIKVETSVVEEDKKRVQVFEGTVIKIKGRGDNRSFTVRRIGAQKVGIEKIFPLIGPVVEEVVVVKKGLRGVRRAKLYFIRRKSQKDIDQIHKRAARREENKERAAKEKAQNKRSPKRKTKKQ